MAVTLDRDIDFRRPHLGLMPLETPRALSEFTWLLTSAPFLKFTPKGDGHPVVVCPGFMASDKSTKFLRAFLKSRNYQTFGWELGRNFGPKTVGHQGELLVDRIRSIHEETGQKVSLVGWSLGGVLARETAKKMPDEVRQVITLGSPFGGAPKTSNIAGLYKALTGHDFGADEDYRELEANLHRAPEHVPSTSIFSKTDAIVSWKACLEPKSEITQNIEVYASHCGLGMNPLVFSLLADRLVLNKDNWQKFNVSKNFLLRSLMPRQKH
ncbi:MAG: lipase family alpha/beta hydrolase [Maricaulaceae bacterium]